MSESRACRLFCWAVKHTVARRPFGEREKFLRQLSPCLWSGRLRSRGSWHAPKMFHEQVLFLGRPHFDPVSTPFRPHFDPHFDPISTLLRNSLRSNCFTSPPTPTRTKEGLVPVKPRACNQCPQRVKVALKAVSRCSCCRKKSVSGGMCLLWTTHNIHTFCPGLAINSNLQYRLSLLSHTSSCFRLLIPTA